MSPRSGGKRGGELVETGETDIPPRNGDEGARGAPGTAADARGASAPPHDHAKHEGGAGSATERMTPLHPNQIWVLRIRGAIVSLLPIVGAWVLDRSLPRDAPLDPGLIPAFVALLALAALILLPQRRWRAWGYRE